MSTLLEKYRQKVAKDNTLFEEKCKGIAYSLARKIVKGQLAEKYNLDESECDSLVEDKVALVKKYAAKILPKVRQQKMNRQQSFTQGSKLQNFGSEEHSDDINEMFKEYYDESERGYDQQRAANPTDKVIVKLNKPNPRAMPPIQFGPPEQRLDDPKLERSLQKKSARSNMPVETLKEVFLRGFDAWTENTGVTQEQYGFARVNSFINGGKSYTELDVDLSEALGAAVAAGAALTGVGYLASKVKQKADEYLDPKEPSLDEKPPEGYELWKKDQEKAAYQGTPPKPHPRDKEYSAYRQKERQHDKDTQEFKAKQAKRAKIRSTAGTMYRIASAQSKAQGGFGQAMNGPVGGPPSGVRESVNEQNISDTSTLTQVDKRIATLGGPKTGGVTQNKPRQTLSSIDNKVATIGGQKSKTTFNPPKPVPSNVVTGYNPKADTNIQEAREPGKPYVKPHVEKYATKQSGWKASDKWGRVKYFGMEFKKSAEKHAFKDGEVTEAFKNWKHEFAEGEKTKVLHGPGVGKRGTVLAKHNNGEFYTIKHGDGSIKKYHISALEIPYNVSEDVANAEKITTDPNKPSTRFIGSNAIAKTFRNETPGQKDTSLNESFDLAFDYQGKPSIAPTAGNLMMKAQGAFAHHTDVQNVLDVQSIKESIQKSFEKTVLAEDSEDLAAHVEQLSLQVEQAYETIEKIKASNVERDAWSEAQILKLEQYIESVGQYVINIEEGMYRGDRKGVPISATWVVGPDGRKRYRRGYTKRQPTSDTQRAPLSGPVSV